MTTIQAGIFALDKIPDSTKKLPGEILDIIKNPA